VSEGKVIEFVGVSMTFGDTPAVEDLTARVEPGRVTAFLGPNGAGKTTTLRALLGDLRPTNGTATIGGTEYARIAKPAASIGAVMSIAPLERARRKTAVKYLTRSARRIGVGASRAREVLQIVGLAEMGDMRIGSLSLGMKHRLAVAEALLGDPGVLVFDEPANGLDPEGIRWIRLLMRGFADEGRTVLMSSHLLSEVEQVADALLILNEGRLLFEGPIELLAEAEGGMVTVDADDRAGLAKALASAGFSYRVLRSGLAIDETTTSEIGTLANTAGIALTTLTHRGPTLEDVYLQIIEGSWVAPARTAALAPAPLSFDEVLAGSSEEAVADPAADPEDADPQTAEESVAAAPAEDEGDVSDDEGSADADVPEEPAGSPSDTDSPLWAATAFPAANFAAPAETSEATESAFAFPAASFATAAAPADESDPESPSGTGLQDNADDAEDADGPEGPARPASHGAAVAAGSLPGLAGLAGLAQGLRSDDEDSNDELPEGLVSPGLAAAFARAGEIEAQMSDIEADIETQESRAENVDAVAQIEAMFEPRGVDGGTSTEQIIEVDPFPGEGLDGIDGDGD